MKSKKKMKPCYTIAVTGLNAIDSPGPGVPVIRSLKEASSFDVRIIGLSYEALEPGIYMRNLVDKVYQVPYPSAGTDMMFERFRYIQSIEKIDFLFPNFDAELFNFIKLEQKLRDELGVRMVVPSLQQFESRNKVNLFEYGKNHGVKVPAATLVHSAREVSAKLVDMNFPIVVKGKFYDAKIAYTNEQAIQHFDKISAQWGLPVLLQEFIPGTELNVCGVGDGAGKLVGAVPMRKLYITDKGKAWAGVTISDKKLIELTRKLVKETQWNGPFELEVMKTVDDKYYLIEINPRFPAWCYLTTGAGQNQVESVVNIGMGNDVTYFRKYETGKLFIRYAYDMIVNMNEFEQISINGEL